MPQILDGRSLAQKIRSDLAQQLKPYHSSPHLVVFLSYPDPASQIYVKHKITACKEVGIRTTILEERHTSTEALLKELSYWNNSEDVDGILVQFPLHKDVNQRAIMQHINPDKDVDGLSPLNLGKLVLADPSGFIPCTPLGIQTILTSHDISLSGKHVVIVGRSITVGKPLSLLLSQAGPAANATVTLANSFTENLAEICRSADILIVAAGRAGLITEDMVREGTVIVDVGINRGDNTIIGDVDFASVQHKCSAITPVPGGVGPMTIASLLSNTVKSFLKRQSVSEN